METLHHDDKTFVVRELSRPPGWLCRHLVSEDGAHQFLEYVVSVSPYKIDVCRVHRLDDGEIEGVRTGTISLGKLARRLAERRDRSDEPSER